jgi:hypothetical protein
LGWSAATRGRRPIFPPDGDKEEVNRKGNSNLPPAQVIPEDAKGTGFLFSLRSLTSRSDGTFGAREVEEFKASDRRLSS